MYLSILILPLLMIIIICIWGRYLSHKGIFILICIMMIELLIISILLNYEILLNNNLITINLNINYGILNINWLLFFDKISSIMILMIISICYIVIIYTYDYMINDPHINRFYLYILIFIFNMLILITTNNIIILFIGWEGVGLSSFLLISYWYTRLQTSLGGLIALFMNRVGDIFLIISILIAYLLFNSTDLIIINSYPNFNSDLFIFFFFLAATAKSAQLYFHFWLPYSMEGPTPISALIHAATMVTAGIYILLRISILISYSYYSLIIIAIIGSLTCFIGGSLALVSIDMKELIAYSTMSQLGYMVTCIGLKLYNLSFFHLIFHAYFKALLFLTVGSILHTILDIQDMRFNGGLFHFLPISYIILLFGLTSLIGLPFTTGYYSKENIIMMSYNYSNSSHLDLILSEYVFIITLLTAFITILYSYKFIYNLFFNTTKLSLFLFQHLHFYSLHLTFSISLLSLITLIIGFLLNKWNILLNINQIYLNHNIDFIIKFIPLSFFIFSYLLLNFIFNSKFQLFILNIQFGFQYLYLFISGLFIHLSYRILYKFFDYGFIDLLIPITGEIQLYKGSQFISKYIHNSFILSIILFSLFITLYLL